MFSTPSYFRLLVSNSVLIAAGLLLPAVSHAGGQSSQLAPATIANAQCSAATTQQPQWAALAHFLELHGLALIGQCPGMHDAVRAKLVVLDSVKASELLRGPLADGDEVETGGRTAAGAVASQGDAQWSPDVHFNRQWLASVMEQHRFVQTGSGDWIAGSARGPLRIATR